MPNYLIFNKERSIGGGLANWWKPGERGYTYRIEEAGRYSEEDAKRIVENARGGDLMIPEADVVDGKLTTYTSIDLDVDNNLADIEKLGKDAYAATEPANAGIDRAGVPADR